MTKRSTLNIFGVCVFTICIASGAVAVRFQSVTSAQEATSVTETQNHIPRKDAQRNSLQLNVKLTDDHVDVMLTNLGKKTVVIWEHWNSWGYKMISFNVRIKGNDKNYRISMKDKFFTRNFPSSFKLFRSEYHGYLLNLTETDRWEIPTELQGLRKEELQIQAEFNIKKTPDAVDDSVFIGTLKSKWHTLTPPQKWY